MQPGFYVSFLAQACSGADASAPTASDPPAGKRLILLDVPDYEAVLQNEEHFVIETPAAERQALPVATYAIGILAAFWLIERLASLAA